LIAEYKKRYVLLTGHGKEMMINIITRIPELKHIALHYEHMQAAILLNDNSMFAGSNPNLKRNLDKFYDSKPRMIKALGTLSGKLITNYHVIFNSKYIENPVDPEAPKVSTKSGKEFEFPANINLLELIFFELFINAKKNRFHFFKGEKIDGIGKNHLSIVFDLLDTEFGKKVEIVVQIHARIREIRSSAT
jgi:hypothetical protein